MLPVTSVTSMHGAAASGETKAPEPRMVRAAHEFEAQMMKELLQPMSRNDALFREDDGDDKGILGEFASESLAGALSTGGGLGIADRLIHEISFGTSSARPPVIGKCKRIP